MAGFKLMKNSDYMNLVQEGTLITNLNQGAGVPTFLENQTLQKLIQPLAKFDNPVYNNSSTATANNTLAQSNYMNARRMR